MDTLVRFVATFLAPVMMNLLGFWAIAEDFLMKVTRVSTLGWVILEEYPYPSPLSYMGLFVLLLSYYLFLVVGRRRGN